MPTLDVSWVLDDPDFQDVFTVTRNVQSVGSGGIATVTSATYNVTGVVTQNSSFDLLKFPEAEHLSGSITIHSVFRLTNGDGATDADVVTWNGRVYQVKEISDWSRYGTGFVMAVCILKPVSP